MSEDGHWLSEGFENEPVLAPVMDDELFVRALIRELI
jgi:hypothetical protein